MTTQKQLPKNLRYFLKVASLSSLALIMSCSDDEILSDSDLNSVNENDLSSSSVELPVLRVNADVEQSANPASNAIDSDSKTRWSGFGSPVNLDLDLGSVSLIDYVNIAYHKGDERTNSFKAYTSSNNSDWTLVGTKVSSGSTESLETFDLSNSNARYLRLACSGNVNNNWNSILDIEVFGREEDDSTVGGGEVPGPITELSGMFTLEDFQIETSWLTGENSRTTESFTATSEDNEDWYDKVGSTYGLKCLKTDGNRTEWKEFPGKESSLYTYKKMNFKANVEDVPEHGVTITQVHNRGGVKRPLLRVYIDGDRYMKIRVTRTSPDANSSSYDTYVGPFYKEGTDFRLEVLTDDGRVSISIETTDGSISETITPSGDWDDFSDSYYLKAGVYTEGDDTKPEITFDYFVVDK